jgi:hypothetical protein
VNLAASFLICVDDGDSESHTVAFSADNEDQLRVALLDHLFHVCQVRCDVPRRYGSGWMLARAFRIDITINASGSFPEDLRELAEAVHGHVPYSPTVKVERWNEHLLHICVLWSRVEVEAANVARHLVVQ